MVDGTIKPWSLDEVIGEELIEIEHITDSDKTVSGSVQELVLHFTNGKEILIFVHQDGTVHVDGD